MPLELLKGKPSGVALSTLLVAIGGTLIIAIGLLPYFLGQATSAFNWLLIFWGIATLSLFINLWKLLFWAWASAVILSSFGIIISLVGLNAIVFVLEVAILTSLYYSREHYGVGVTKVEEEDLEKKKALLASRTENPMGLICPKCGSKNLYICEDGSAFCHDCKSGSRGLKRL